MVWVSWAVGGPEGREAAGNALGPGDSLEQVSWMLAWHSAWWKASPAMGWPLQKSRLQGRNGPAVWNRKLTMNMTSITCPRGSQGCRSRSSCCFSVIEDSNWCLQSEKPPHLIQRIHEQHFWVTSVIFFLWKFCWATTSSLAFSPLMDVQSWKLKTAEDVCNDCVWIICVFHCDKRWRWTRALCWKGVPRTKKQQLFKITEVA